MIQQAKVVVLGCAGVGKSSLTARFISNQFDESIPATFGAAFYEKTHKFGKNQSIKFQFWDTAGQERFRSIAKIYYKQAKAALILYDVTNKETFEGLKDWISELRENGPENIFIAIVGNKVDLLDHRVSIIQAQQYSRVNHALFKLISVKQNKGIQQLFDELAIQLSKPQQDKTPKPKSNIFQSESSRLSLDKNQKNKKKGCC